MAEQCQPYDSIPFPGVLPNSNPLLYSNGSPYPGFVTVTLDKIILPIDVRRQAERLLNLIQNAESMTQANRNGALAEGFVLGMETLKSMHEQTLEQLDLLFSRATDQRLVELSR
jgi:hypothetical protein